MLQVFVDSDAFVALARERDASHERALVLLKKLIRKQVVFHTSNYVFSESITVISLRENHAAALEFIEQMQSPESSYILMRADDDLDNQAISTFQKQTSKNTSFVDCANMAFMRQLHADAIFSFDAVYRKNGFALVEDLFFKRK